MRLVKVLVPSGSLTYVCGLPLWGSFVYFDSCPCALFSFLSLSWVLSFYKVLQGFIIILGGSFVFLEMWVLPFCSLYSPLSLVLWFI
jgi:hypothetical protein